MSHARHHLAEVIAQRTLYIHDDAALAREIAAYLLHEHHTAELNSLIRDILQYRSDHGHVEATVVSAHQLTEQVLADVKRELRNEFPDARNITVNHQLDPGVIGGIRIDLANEQLDLTARAKLNAFKRLTGAGQE